MKAAILFSGKFGSTRQYAEWLGEATGLPVFDLRKNAPEPWDYDLLILGTSIIVGKPIIARWMKKNWNMLWGRKILLFSVSGTAPDHPDLQTWMRTHLGDEIRSEIRYVPLRGRLNPEDLPWWMRTMLKMVSRASKDPETKKRMSEGFDYMDRDSLEPILTWYRKQTTPVVTKKDRVPELV